jgi:predicted nucleic acid-binding protein
MNLYAESSAVLSWLLGEKDGPIARRHLQGADIILSSHLTLVECDRALRRAVALTALVEAQATTLGARLATTARYWNILGVIPEILDRARQSFPGEPIRTLDALHIASALHARSAVTDLALLSFDDRIRKIGAGLGFPLLPA